MKKKREEQPNVSDEVESKLEGDGPEPPADGQANGGSAEARLAALAVERDEMKDRMLRIAAEFENWKKRARKEQEDGEAKVRESVLRDMLDVIDNLERAVSAYGQGDGSPKTKHADKGAAPAVDGPAILKGVGLVLRLAHSKLDRYGVKSIAAHGQPFDPRIHEAISRVESAEHPAGSVAVELQRGYLIGERLLRPAMVSVASAPARPEGAKGGPDKPGGGNSSGGGVEDNGA